MAFKATVVACEQAFSNIRKQAAATKVFMQQNKVLMQQSPCDSQIPLNVIQHCGINIARMDAWAATPGLVSYATAQVNDPSYDIVAEYQAMRSAMVSCRNDLMAMFPKDATGYLLYHTLDVDGRVQSRSFTAAQLAAAVVRMDAVIASIE